MRPDQCQLHAMSSLPEPLGKLERIRQFFLHRLKRMVKRRIHFVGNVIRERGTAKSAPVSTEHTRTIFSPGEKVRIRSRAEIQQTLDPWDELKGCGFMEEMWPYCGTEQKIFKRVEQFLDERDYRVKKVRGIYLLEGLLCQGTVDFGRCDRSCFFFWREEWLEKVDNP